jgi:hypothetical protein
VQQQQNWLLKGAKKHWLRAGQWPLILTFQTAVANRTAAAAAASKAATKKN